MNIHRDPVGGGGGVHLGFNGYPLPSGRAVWKQGTPTFRGGQLILGKKRGWSTSNQKHSYGSSLYIIITLTLFC